jgi:sugar-specific transcriptional regulator TrmB
LLSLDGIARDLMDFGLTLNQARVYVTLLKLGVAPVIGISKLSGVRREEVYRALGELEKRGIVERIIGKPLKFKTLPLEQMLPELLEQRRQKFEWSFSKLQTKKKDLMKKAKTLKAEAVLEEKQKIGFVSVTNGNHALQKIVDMIEKTKEQLLIALSIQDLKYGYLTRNGALRHIVQNGAAVKILTEIKEKDVLSLKILDEIMKLDGEVEIRHMNNLPSQMTVIDNKEAIVGSFVFPPTDRHVSLWTDDPSFVKTVTHFFYDSWNVSVDMKSTLTGSASNEVLDFCAKMKPRSHGILFYMNKEEKHRTLFCFIKAGIEQGEAIAYIATKESVKEIRKAMKKFGIDVDRLEETGGLHIVDYKDWYIFNGKSDPKRTMRLWESLLEKVMERGFSGLRATGEMVCFFEHNCIEDLVTYEKLCGKTFATPFTALCAYDSSVVSQYKIGKKYLELIQAHGCAIFGGAKGGVTKSY